MSLVLDIRDDLGAKKVDAEILSTLISSGVNKSFLYETYTEYKSNEDVSNNANIYLIDYFKGAKKDASTSELRTRYESFNDDVQKNIYKAKAKKLMKPIRSKSYSHLISDDGVTEKLFLELAFFDVDKSFIQDNIGKKIKTFSSSDDLNNTLGKLVSSFGDWNIHSKLNKIKEYDVNIISTKDNKLIFEVNNFEASNELGSPMWCITREDDTFQHYREDVERIVFCYDFNKEVVDNESSTAYIVSANGSVSSGYYKDDVSMQTSEFGHIDALFESYDSVDFSNRLDQKGYSEENKYLIMLGHGFTEDGGLISTDDLNYDNFTIESFNDIISKRKTKAIENIIKNNPEILIEGSHDKGAFLRTTIDFIMESFSPEVLEMLHLILDDEKLLSAASNDEYISLFQDPIMEFGFCRLENIDDLFKKYVDKSNLNVISLLEKAEGIPNEIYSALDYVDVNIKNVRKATKPEWALKIALSHPMSSGIEYLDINKTDDKFIQYLKDTLNENSKIDVRKKIELLNELSKRNVIISTLDPTEDIKKDILSKPRKITSYKSEIQNFNIKFTKEETMDLISNLVFDENFIDLGSMDKRDLYEDFANFKLPKPLLKLVVNNVSLDNEGVKSFVKHLDKIAIELGDHKSSDFEKSMAVLDRFKHLQELRTSTSNSLKM